MGNRVVLGNLKFMADRGVRAGAAEAVLERLADDGKTAIVVGVDGEFAGVIAVAATIKDDSVAAIRRLHHFGLEVSMDTSVGSLETVSHLALARQVSGSLSLLMASRY
jgi:cation transport ATPase